MDDFITARQINAAMGFLGWDNSDLAKRVGCNPNTISRARNGSDTPTGPRRITIAKIKRAVESAGVRFTPAGGVEPAPVVSPSMQQEPVRAAL